MQTINEAAKTLGVSTRRVRKLCEQQRIAGARRRLVLGGYWWELPDVLAIKPGKRGRKLGEWK